MSNISHAPSRPVRPDVIGEVVFMDEWQKLAGRMVLDQNHVIIPFLLNVLRQIVYTSRKQVTQREAMVAASFIKWLGTNCGNCFLEGLLIARKQAPLMGEREACAERWARENIIDQRTGLRCIQILLANEKGYVPGILPGLSHVGRHVSYSAHDVDVVECVACWLGSDGGLAFVERCKARIKAHHREAYADMERRLAEAAASLMLPVFSPPHRRVFLFTTSSTEA